MLKRICAIIAVAGAVNWTMWRMWQTDMVRMLGIHGVAAQIIFIGVGVASLYLVFEMFLKSKE